MSTSMFCPKCGAGDQAAESYCKRCGGWLTDPDSPWSPGLFRIQTRDQKIKKMRALEAVSAGLSLTAAAIIIGFVSTGRNGGMLALAALCCVLVAVYQGINFYLGYKVQHRIDQSRSSKTASPTLAAHSAAPQLQPERAADFTGVHSVIDNTTELLEPVPRRRDSEE